MNLKNRKMVIAALCMMLCAMLLAGCGKSLIITTGFGRGEVFRIGSEGCRISELKVYLLDLQKENERLFGSAIWEGGDSKELQDAVKEQALSQVTRVKALNQIAVKRNVMLTELEKREAEEAEHKYYAGLSAAEIKFSACSVNMPWRIRPGGVWANLRSRHMTNFSRRRSAISIQNTGRLSI